MRPSFVTSAMDGSWDGRTLSLRDPRRAEIAERRRAKLTTVRSQLIVLLYGSWYFLAISLAKRLTKTVAALPMPPAVVKTSGVNDPCSTLHTHVVGTSIFFLVRCEDRLIAGLESETTGRKG